MPTLKSKLINFIVVSLRRFGYLHPKRKMFKHLNRDFHLKEMFDLIVEKPGDIVECGVGYGQSLITFGVLVKREGKGRQVYAYDSFEGFPEVHDNDKTGTNNAFKGHFKDARIETIKSLVRKADIEMPEFVKGFVEDTVQHHTGEIALLHIDLDLYEAYKVTLEQLYDKVVSGGVIAFDEYREPNWPGATKAVDEFFADKNVTINKSPFINKYFIIKN